MTTIHDNGYDDDISYDDEDDGNTNNSNYINNQNNVKLSEYFSIIVTITVSREKEKYEERL